MLIIHHNINILNWFQQCCTYISDILFNVYKKCICMQYCVEDQEYHCIDAYIPGPYDDIKKYHDCGYYTGYYDGYDGYDN